MISKKHTTSENRGFLHLIQPRTFVFLSLILVIVFSFFGSMFAVYLYLSQNSIKTQATTGSDIQISSDFPHKKILKGEHFVLTINAKSSPNTPLVGYTFNGAFNKTALQIANIEYAFGIPSPELGQTKADLQKINTDGVLYIQSEVIGSPALILSQSVFTPLIYITYTASSDIDLTHTENIFTNKSSLFFILNDDNSIQETTGIFINPPVPSFTPTPPIIIPSTHVSLTPVPTLTIVNPISPSFTPRVIPSPVAIITIPQPSFPVKKKFWPFRFPIIFPKSF